MTITPQLFEAYLKCPTKCWLRHTGEAASGNAYAAWVSAQDDVSRVDGIKRLIAEMPESSCALAPPAESLKSATWRLATDVAVRTPNTETLIPVIERIPSEVRGKVSQFVPVHFVWRNKLHRDDKLLLGFDALVLSKTLGRDVSVGKIVHGDEHATAKVKLSTLVGEIGKLVEKTSALLAMPSPPDLVLNRHCAECEFQARCRQKALEKDDLRLLSSMSEPERKELHGRGILTVTQLSYTFRPRRRPRHLRDKREKYHHALKALAMREKKTYVVGIPEFKIEGTPVYLDVEALPDTDFYYLIGVRVKAAGGVVHCSFWADEIGDMATIWEGFVNLLVELDRPCLVHYGSFETIFLKRMGARFGGPPAHASGAIHAIEHPVNLLSAIYAQIYFPAYSNGLKEVAKTHGFKWSETDASGQRSVVWRNAWSFAARGSRFGGDLSVARDAYPEFLTTDYTDEHGSKHQSSRGFYPFNPCDPWLNSDSENLRPWDGVIPPAG